MCPFAEEVHGENGAHEPPLSNRSLHPVTPVTYASRHVSAGSVQPRPQPPPRCGQVLGREPNPRAQNTLGGIEESTRKRGLDIKGLKGGTCYGIASAVTGLVRTILWNEQSAVSVSTLIGGEYEYGERDVFPSLPVVLDGTGRGTSWTCT